MKITFVGTSHGRPELNRKISGTLFEINGEFYIFDMGAQVNAHMVDTDKDVKKIRAIFVSHMHIDHICSLPALLNDIDSYRKAEKRVACYLPEETAEKSLFDWLIAMHENPNLVHETFDFPVIKVGKIYEDENITVVAKPTRHLEGAGFPAFAFEIYAEGKSILFTGDMMPRFPEYEQVVCDKHYDLVICEMAHANIAASAETIKKANTDRMIFNHIYPKQIAGAAEALASFPFEVEIATDGLEITI